jgi:hypothetical protein
MPLSKLYCLQNCTAYKAVLLGKAVHPSSLADVRVRAAQAHKALESTHCNARHTMIAQKA